MKPKLIYSMSVSGPRSPASGALSVQGNSRLAEASVAEAKDRPSPPLIRLALDD